MYMIRVSPDLIGSLGGGYLGYLYRIFSGTTGSADPNTYSSEIMYRPKAYQYCSSHDISVAFAI